jgi:nitroreductase
MDALEAILTRRSVRKYDSRPVADELVTELLRAAMAAPSAGNQQPWHFIVVRDRALLDGIADFHPYGAMTRQAALAIVVCADLRLEQRPGFWVQDCSAATQNLLLAAHARGLGAVWLGVHPRPERVEATRALFSLPEHVVPLAIVPLGYPAETPSPTDRYDPRRVHLDRW